MESYAKILSIKQNNLIKIEKGSRKNYSTIFICSFVIVSIMLCLSIENVKINEVASSMCYVYNPVNSLYSDNSALIFANATLSSNNLDFTVPIISTESEVLGNGDVIFGVVKSIMVKAVEDGVVEEIDVTTNGIKYIKIRHSVDVCSYIENIDIVGVGVYDKVKQGQEIATTKLGEKITLRLFLNDVQVQNLSVHQSKIIWE